MSDDVVLVRMLKLMAGPEGSRHPKKHYAISAAEAQRLVDAGAAEIVSVPTKRPAVETAVRRPPENADASPFAGAATPRPDVVITTESEAEKRERYRLEAVNAGVAEDSLDCVIDDRLMHELLVADGANAIAAAAEIWGKETPSYPWIPRESAASTDPSTPKQRGRGGRRGGAR